MGRAATRVGEPYPLPVEFLFFTADPEDCSAVAAYTCTGDCVAACSLAPGESVAVGCAHCEGGGAGCDFLAWVRECDGREWTFRRAEVLPEASSFSLTGGGSATSPTHSADGLSVVTTLTAGPAPGLHELGFTGRAVPRQLKPDPVTGELEILPETFPPWSATQVELEVGVTSLGSFHGLEVEILEISPETLELTEGGVTDSATTFRYRIEPPDYEASLVVVEIEDEDGLVADLTGTTLSGDGQAVLPRGSRLDASRLHRVRAVVNPGAVAEVASDPVDLPLGQQILRRFDDPFLLSQDTDLALGQTCAQGQPLRFTLGRDAEVTLSFQRAVSAGAGGVQVSGTPIVALDGEPLEAGEQSHVLSLAELPPGDYQGTLRVVDDQGVVEERQFLAVSEYRVTDHRRIGQTLLQGVNLAKGNLALSREDLLVPGRGVSLSFQRSYASSASQVPGALGVGWTHNWESRIEVTACSEVLLIGGEGSAVRFVDDGAGGLAAGPGTHGTMVADPAGGAFDFYATGGVRYHYDPVSESRWELSWAADRDGNTTTLTYSGSGDGRLLRRVTDASGRSLDFVYAGREFALWEGDVLVRVLGPDGLEMVFDYDAQGQLSLAQRELGSRQELYTYEGVASWPFEARRALTAAIDGLDGARTEIAYQVADVQAAPGLAVRSLLVREMRPPVDGVTTFTWDAAALAGRSPATHRVTDGRGEESTYRFNTYGNPLEIVDPLTQSTTLDWDTQNQVMTGRTDGNGVDTTYTYDVHGNPLTETVTVTDFDGTEHVYAVTNTYVPASQPPYQRNLLATRTDRNGHTTTFTYDAAGNLLSRSIEVTDAAGETTTVAVHHTYATGGDRLTTTDPRGGVTTFQYDAAGHLEQVTDPLGHTTRTRWNDRGLPVEITDPLGRTTFLEYDRRGRLIRRQHPDGAIERSEYFDNLNLRIDTDPLGRVTRTTRDREGRVVLIENAAGGQKVYEYDADGHKILESRWFDGTTPRDDVLFEYDAAGRLITRRETLGRLTRFEYDAVGNVIRERLESEIPDDDFAPRLRETDYDELDRPIVVRRQLGEGFVTERMKLDGEGNTILELDALGRATVMGYDALNRLIRSDEAGLRERRRFYDGSGNLVRDELDVLVDGEPATQTRAFVYDAAHRLTAEVDALGHTRAMEYDAAGNLVRELDRRGHLIAHAYDARDRRIRTTVHLDRITSPQRELVTEMRYDSAGNRVGETLPNGNELTHVYDPLNRLTATTDTLGPVMAYAYDARGNRVRETDANGHETLDVYDVFDRLVRQELPEDRVVTLAYDVAGNRVSQTDARDHTTTYRYDSLNRQVAVTDALEHTATTEYDAVGNALRRTDRRGSVTDFEYDDLDRLVLRTDPEVGGERYATAFVYDAADNLLRETDRRGILTEHRYDLENRRTHTTRDGLLIEQVEHDEEGNVTSRWDANRNLTVTDYDERGLRLAERRPLEATTTFEHDGMGNVVLTTDPEGRQAARTYDLRQRLETETRGGDETTTYGYDGNGNRTSMLRPEGGEWTYTFDGADRLTAVVNPESDRTEFTYDENGNLASQTDGELNLTEYGYDELDRQTLVTYPDLATEVRTYDEEGNLATMTDPKGQVATFTYDALGRETRREVRESESTPDFAQAVASTYDRNNNLLETVEQYRGAADQTTTRAYDTFDRLESIIDRWGRRLAYVYGASGNRTRLTDPAGEVTTYAYDALNRVASVQIPGGGTTHYQYFKNSLPKKVTYPNGTTAEHTYDDANRVLTIDNRHNAVAEVSSFTYTYDKSGNRLSQIETHSGLPSETTTYGYDDADRLLDVTYPDTITTYTYDGAGNRQTETDTDLAGTTTLAEKVYTYNSRNQLTELTDALDPAATVTYGYDANGNQTSRTTGGAVTTFTFDVRDPQAPSSAATSGTPGATPAPPSTPKPTPSASPATSTTPSPASSTPKQGSWTPKPAASSTTTPSSATPPTRRASTATSTPSRTRRSSWIRRVESPSWSPWRISSAKLNSSCSTTPLTSTTTPTRRHLRERSIRSSPSSSEGLRARRASRSRRPELPISSCSSKRLKGPISAG